MSVRAQRARRAWLRSGGEYSRSFPAMDPSAPPLGGPSTSVDAEALGAYLQNYASTGYPVSVADRPPLHPDPDAAGSPARHVYAESSTSGFTNASQPNDCRGASSDTRRGCVDDATECAASSTINVGETEPGAISAAAVIVAVEDQPGDDCSAGVTPIERVACACEGACGCANDGDTPVDSEPLDDSLCRRLPRRRRRPLLPQLDNGQNQDLNRDADHEPEESSGARNSGDAEAICPKSAIIRLLGSARCNSRASQNCSLNSTTVSTASSTPSGTCGRAFGMDLTGFRKVSVCSRDSHVTKISMISSSHSSERLNDEFEIVSESASILGTTNPSTPIGTPRFFGSSLNSRQHGRRPPSSSGRHRRRRPSLPYSSCDLESLYESIQALDNFLVRRGMSINQARNQSVAVMLFGTPEHTRTYISSARSSSSAYPQEANEATGFINGSKSWRSSDDAFSN